MREHIKYLVVGYLALLVGSGVWGSDYVFQLLYWLAVSAGVVGLMDAVGFMLTSIWDDVAMCLRIWWKGRNQ